MAKYDAWASTYAANRRARPETVAAIIEHGAIGPASRVLEVGAGTGNHIIAIEQQLSCNAHGLEQSAEMMSHAAGRGSKVHFRQGDAEDLPHAAESFDTVFSIDVIHHLTSTARYFRSAHQVLKPGGRLLTMTHSHDMLRNNVFVAKYWPAAVPHELSRYPDIATLRDELAATGFRDIREQAITYPRRIDDIAPYANKAFSSLHFLSSQDFETGLAKLRGDLDQRPIENTGAYLILCAAK